MALVLIVDDEPLVRMNAANMVEEGGYDAIEASNADEALRILESRSDVQIVFSDVNMPGSMDGLRLLQVVHDRWPPIHLVLASGKDLPKGATVPDDGLFLPKPYGRKELMSALARAS